TDPAASASRGTDDRPALRIQPVNPDLPERLPVQLGDLDVQQHLAGPRNDDPVDDGQACPAHAASHPATHPASTTRHATSGSPHRSAAARHTARHRSEAWTRPDGSLYYLEDVGHHLGLGHLAIEDDLAADLADLDLGARECLVDSRLQLLRVHRDPDEEGNRAIALIPEGQAGGAKR